MKFEKTYYALLPSFPESWRERAIAYGRLKKLIDEVVSELSLLGLHPAVLRDLLRDDSQSFIANSLEILDQPSSSATLEHADNAVSGFHESAPARGPSGAHNILQSATHAVYELAGEGEAITPRLRLTLGPKSRFSEDSAKGSTSVSSIPKDTRRESTRIQDGARRRVIMASDARYASKPDTLFALQNQHVSRKPSNFLPPGGSDIAATDSRRFLESVDFETPPTMAAGDPREIIISLNSDSAFYQVLISALRSLAEHRTKLQEEFAKMVQQLSLDISNVSQPSSSQTGKSDLYAWRQIFQMWVDGQIFESTTEKDRGERSVEDSEAKLTEFANKVVKESLGDRQTLQRKESRDALEQFLHINVLLLDLKKFQLANSEAARKIIKKHDKRTALIFPGSTTQVTNHPILSALSPLAPRSFHGLTLPHILLVLLTDTLLPIIPSIDDYTCFICTSIAYIPIRLGCSHIFCVRCLVKMQKRGQGECPLCRAPTVLQANRYNVDAALQRFMVDWFPKETKEKDEANQREAAQEQARELGMSDRDCKVA